MKTVASITILLAAWCPVTLSGYVCNSEHWRKGCLVVSWIRGTLTNRWRLMRIILLLVLLPSLAGAQTINNVSGEVYNGGSITISGSSFGANGPTIDLFDDFELGSNGSEVTTGAGVAQVGEWDYVESPYVTYTNNGARGSLAAMHDHTSHYVIPTSALFSGVREIFVSWWIYVPAGTNIPGEPWGVAGRGWKQMWITGSSTNDDDLVVPSLTSHGTAWIINGNDPDPGYSNYVGSMNFNKGYWHHLAVWINGGYNNDGNIHLWRLTEASGNLDLIEEDDNVNTLKSGGAFERVGADLWGSTTTNCYPRYDDIYIAVGDYARARVEIGDNATYLDCTDIAICVPTSWSDTSITVDVYTGNFVDGDDAYIFINDADGNVSSGYAVTIGASESPTITPPSNLTATKVSQ